MKKIICLFIVVLFLLSLVACSNNNTNTIDSSTENTTDNITDTADKSVNPLADKEYEVLVFNAGDDFMEFFSSINEEYSACVISFSDYLEEHSTDIESNGKGFCDFDDYESSLDSYYRFLYGVMYCESDNIPEEYKEAFSIYKTGIWTNKTNLDGLYGLKGQELVNKSSEMLTYIQATTNLVNEAMPTAYTELKLGDTINLDFVDMTIDGTGTADKLVPTDTSKGYSYIADVENEQYYYINGTIKNLSGSNIDVKNIYIQFVFDNKYTYSGQMAACAHTNNFYGESVKPLGTVEYYIYASVPDELIEQYTQCDIIFGFKNEFAGSWFMKESDCEQLYKIVLVR